MSADSNRTLSRTLLSVLVAAVLATVAAATSCGGSETYDDDDHGCTPPTAIDLALTLQGTNAAAFAGNPVALRVLAGGDMVMSCTTSLVGAGGTFTLAGGAFGPVGDARAELVVSSDGDVAFGGEGDSAYTFALGVDGTVTGGPCEVDQAWTLSVDVASTAESAVTWTPGLGCPGE